MNNLFDPIDIKEKIFISINEMKMVGKEERPAVGFFRFKIAGDWDYGKNRIICYIYLLGIP